MPMSLEIIPAERQVFSDEVDMVIAPGFDGQLGILPKHAPLMTMLKPGELMVRKNGRRRPIRGRLWWIHGSLGQPRQRARRRVRKIGRNR